MNSAIIFGGSKGIGRLITDHLSDLGWQITVAARALPSAEESRPHLQFVSADVGCQAQVERVFSKHREAFLSIPQVVIHTAAVQGPIGYAWECSDTQWHDCIRTNLTGSFHVATLAIRSMIQRGSGTIILFSGGGAVYSRPHFSAYAASKSGVLRLVEVLNDELRHAGHNGITVNAIAPGAVRTAMTEEILQSKVPLTTEEIRVAEETAKTGGTQMNAIVSLIEFLSDPARSRYLSGRLIHVRENYVELVERYLENVPEDIGKLRRIPI